jgi:hypothetical protein
MANPLLRTMPRFVVTALLLGAIGCASRHEALADPAIAPLAQAQGADADHFLRDRAAISEEQLRQILDAPVGLAANQRIGVLAVGNGFQPDLSLPLATAPSELTHAVETAGLFQSSSEISAEWPADRGLGGLRELAARYRSGYLLLYRQRFVAQSYANAWTWLVPTVIGAIVAPSRTLETAGVLEASLFDVRSGTILFTVYERTRGTSDETPWASDRKLHALQEKLLEPATSRLADQVVAKARLLPAAAAAQADAAAPARD